MNKYNFNKILAVIICAGLLAAFAIVYHRNVTESANNTVEIMMDYNDLLRIAQTDGIPVETVAKQFKAVGVTSLAVYDVTLEELARQNLVALQSGESMMAQAKSGYQSEMIRALAAGGLLSGAYTYVFDNGYSEFASLKTDLGRRFGKEHVKALNAGGQQVICIATNYEDIEKDPIAISAKQLRDVSGYGFYVVARPFNYKRVTKPDVNAVFERLAAIPSYRYSGIMFAGIDVLGYRSLLGYTAEKMKQSGIPLYVCESPLQLQFMKQDGLADMVRLDGYNAARAYVIIKEEQPKLQMDTMVHRFQIAALERNVRIAFLRRIEKPLPDMNLLQTNLRYANNVRAELQERDFVIGKAGIYNPYFPKTILLVLACMGAAAAAVMLLANLARIRPGVQLTVFALLAAVLCFPVIHGGAIWSRQFAALLAAICFPVLAATWAVCRLDSYKFSGKPAFKIALDGVGMLASVLIAALVGGIFIGAILGDIRFLLEAEIFRGVKVAFILPPLLIAAVYLRRHNLLEGNAGAAGEEVRGQFSRIWSYPVYIKTLVLLGVGAVIAWVLVGRSGDASGVPVPALELKMRYFLENVMYARPREKEFMVGHPAFFVLLFAFWRRWPQWIKLVLIMAVTVGLASAVETFCHLRSAIFLSTLRAFDGLAAGVVIGLVAFVVLNAAGYLQKKFKEHK